MRQVKPKLQSRAQCTGQPHPTNGRCTPCSALVGAAQARLPAPHQRAGEDLRDDPVQIVKEGRPLPQDAAP